MQHNTLTQALDSFIHSHSLSDQLTSAIHTQGIVTALAAAPYQANPNEWLNIFWFEENAPFTNAKQLEDFAQLIVSMWNEAREHLLSNQWQWPESCHLNEAYAPNQAIYDFCKGLLQGWQITLNDWQTIMPKHSPNVDLLNGVLISINILYAPEEILGTPKENIDPNHFIEVFNAIPMMLAGITMRAAELAQ